MKKAEIVATIPNTCIDRFFIDTHSYYYQLRTSPIKTFYSVFFFGSFRFNPFNTAMTKGTDIGTKSGI